MCAYLDKTQFQREMVDAQVKNMYMCMCVCVNMEMRNSGILHVIRILTSYMLHRKKADFELR